MATLASQQIVQTGLTPAYAGAAGGGDKCAPGASNFLHVKNGGGGSVTVTVDSVVPSNYGTDVNLVVAVPAGEERMIGPLPEGRFAGTDGLVAISYSGVTSVTIAAFRF